MSNLSPSLNKKVFDLFKKSNLPGSIVKVVPMERGYSNFSFLVSTDLNKNYKFRIASNNDIISRNNEIHILENTGEEYIYYDKETGDSVWSWIKGKDLIGVEITKEIIKKLVLIVEKIHTKDTEGVWIHDDLEFIETHGDKLEKEDLELYINLVNKYQNEKKCLCHNDISLSNLIYDEKTKELKIIDFEWGRVNHPYWDYGNFVKEADLEEEKVIWLAEEANLSLHKLYEFALLATLYSIQLSYVFKQETVGLKSYRERLFVQLEKYKKCILKK